MEVNIPKNSRPAVADIKLWAANEHKLTVAEIDGPRRKKSLVAARHKAIYVVFVKRPDFSYPEIARMFGGLDHTSVMYAVRKMKKNGEGEKAVREWDKNFGNIKAPPPPQISERNVLSVNSGFDKGFRVIRKGTPEYPQHVKGLLLGSVPFELCALGNIDILKMPGVSFSGSRSTCIATEAVQNRLIEGLVERGYSIISGNAQGSDLQAHKACLKNGGYTILVLPEGIQKFKVRPELYEVWDWERCLVISQFKSDESWSVKKAMIRNHLIAGLGRALFVNHAEKETGGTMAAGFYTLRKNGPVYALEATQETGIMPGCKKLIEYGACPISENSDFRCLIDGIKHPNIRTRWTMQKKARQEIMEKRDDEIHNQAY